MTQHVVIAGGGVGALEGLLALQSFAGDRVHISVVTPTRRLTYRALSVAEPFGGEPAPRYDWEHIARDRDVRWVPDKLEQVCTATREIATEVGPPIRYDALLLALGARPETAVPGALPFAGPRDVFAVREAIEALRPDRSHRIVFVAPAGVSWTLPLYELALMTAAYGRERGLDLELEVVTRESRPLGLFGAAASDEVATRLADAGIALRTGYVAEGERRSEASTLGWQAKPISREYDGRRLWLELEGALGADLAIALPRLRGPALRGLPADEEGFVPVDPRARVRGVERVWAVGDMTTWRVKQGGLAAQQADVAATDIAARVAGADVRAEPYRPRLQGKLLTGADPLFLERRPGAPATSEASGEFLWWPAHKVAGRHIGRYLHTLGAPLSG